MRAQTASNEDEAGALCSSTTLASGWGRYEKNTEVIHRVYIKPRNATLRDIFSLRVDGGKA
jgi:hypothetical protein